MLVIHMEDLVANAMIELYKINETTFVPRKFIDIYSEKVIEDLKMVGIYAYSKLSRDFTIKFEEEYQDYFIPIKQDAINGYQLKEDKTIEDLIEQFRGYIPLEVLVSLVDQQVIEKTINQIAETTTEQITNQKVLQYQR